MGHGQVGNNDEVVILNTRSSVSSIQVVQRLGRCIQHRDIHPSPIRDWMIAVARGRGWPAPSGTAVTPVLARLDVGRWIGDCPLGCRGADAVSQSDRIFMCLSCGADYIWYPVVFPDNIQEIEEEVTGRKSIMGWSWNPGETIEELRAESLALKEQVPDAPVLTRL